MKTLVTGGKGLVGNAVRSAVSIEDLENVIFIDSKDGDLKDFNKCYDIFHVYRPDRVIHLAAKVGGVNANLKYTAEFFRETMLINMNVIECCKQFNVKKLVSLLSTCIYPDLAPCPLKEESLHDGEPNVSNFGYAYAKRMLEVQCRTYNKQYGTNFVCLIPNNLYGPYDNFDLENSHVIPALIRKIYEAKISGGQAHLWGDGSSLREFTFSNDLGKIIWWAIEEYEGGPINIGTNEEITIKQAAEHICKLLDFPATSIFWDTSKPSGQYKKTTDKSKFSGLNSKFVYISFKEGISQTIKWFLENIKIDKLRGYRL